MSLFSFQWRFCFQTCLGQNDIHSLMAFGMHDFHSDRVQAGTSGDGSM